MEFFLFIERGSIKTKIITVVYCVTVVTLYLVTRDLYMILKVHSYVKVILLIPSIVL